MGKVGRVLIEAHQRGVVRLWLQLHRWNEDCLVIDSGSPEWGALWRATQIEPPSDLSLDVGGDLREAVRELRGKVIDLGIAA